MTDLDLYNYGRIIRDLKTYWQFWIPFGKHEDGEYGEFTVYVELNNEFIGRILQMGAGLEVVSPEEVRNEFRKRTAELAKLYE